MSDVLVDLAQNRVARELIKRLGLPLPLPEKLVRARGAWGERELDGRTVLVVAGGGDAGVSLAKAGGAATASLLDGVAATLARDGAEVAVAGAGLGPFAAPAEAWSRPAVAWPTPRVDVPLDAIVVDASGFASPDDLQTLHGLVSPWVGALARSSRVVVLARPDDEAATAAAAAAQHGLDGFVRSLAKEIGRRGATANRLVVARGAEARMPAVLRWILSSRAAWMTGQTLHVDGRVAAPSEPALRTRVLTGQTALVTGAARGIGRAMVMHLAAEGALVIALDRPGDEAPLSEVARASGAEPLTLDITAPNAAAIIREVSDHSLDVLIHNAGITRDKTLMRMSEAQWDEALAVNLGAVVSVTDALVAAGLSDHGRVLCMSSIAAIAGNVGQTNYATAKAGLIGYVRALAPRVAARGIRVNALAPGFVETRLTAAIPVLQREVGRRLAALGQGGIPDDVAELATFVVSPGALGITGQTLRICGGNFVGA